MEFIETEETVDNNQQSLGISDSKEDEKTTNELNDFIDNTSQIDMEQVFTDM